MMTVIRLTFRLLAAAALGVSAYVHLRLAPQYPYPGGISGTQLFDLQAGVATVTAVVLLVTGHRWAWAAAASIGLASFAAVILYRYVDVGSLGPLPNMSDPTWAPIPAKPASAVAEALVPVLFALRLPLGRRGRRPTVKR